MDLVLSVLKVAVNVLVIHFQLTLKLYAKNVQLNIKNIKNNFVSKNAMRALFHYIILKDFKLASLVLQHA